MTIRIYYIYLRSYYFELHAYKITKHKAMSRYQLITYKLKGYAQKKLKTNPRDLQLI